MTTNAEWQARKEAAKVRAQAKAEAAEEAARIVAAATQRLASGFVSESTVATVALDSDESKGRIIGREGRNIRAIEAATGADIILANTYHLMLRPGAERIAHVVAGPIAHGPGLGCHHHRPGVRPEALLPLPPADLLQALVEQEGGLTAPLLERVGVDGGRQRIQVGHAIGDLDFIKMKEQRRATGYVQSYEAGGEIAGCEPNVCAS